MYQTTKIAFLFIINSFTIFNRFNKDLLHRKSYAHENFKEYNAMDPLLDLNFLILFSILHKISKKSIHGDLLYDA